MDDLARFDAINRFYQRLENRPIVFNAVSLGMNDNDAKSQLLEVRLELKTLVDRNQDV